MSSASGAPVTDTAGPTTDLASSFRFRTFATVFAISSTVLYIFCEMANLPTFTYHPGTDRIEWGWAPGIKDEGPAMNWYGWLVTTRAQLQSAWWPPNCHNRLQNGYRLP